MSNKLLHEVVNKSYPYGFVTQIESDTVAPGLNEDVIRLISFKKNNCFIKRFFNQIQSFRISRNHESFHPVLPAIARLLPPYHDQCGKNLRATHFPMSLAKGFARKPRTHR